jgi:hypothetical protein
MADYRRYPFLSKYDRIRTGWSGAPKMVSKNLLTGLWTECIVDTVIEHTERPAMKAIAITKPAKFIIRQHRQGMPWPTDINTGKIAVGRAESLATKYAADLGVKVEVIRSLSGEVVATFGA